MALGRVVPWCDWEEWEGVRIGIFSEDPRLRRTALDRVIRSSMTSEMIMVLYTIHALSGMEFPLIS